MEVIVEQVREMDQRQEYTAPAIEVIQMENEEPMHLVGTAPCLAVEEAWC